MLHRSVLYRNATREAKAEQSLVVCLSEYLTLHSVYILVIKVQGFVSQRDQESPWLFFKIMSFWPTCCLQSKRRSNHEINRYVYLL